METQKQTTYEYVFKKPLSIGNGPAKPFDELPEEEKNAWINYFCNWTWRAVECMVDLKNFNPSLRAISKRLNIPVGEAVDAVEGLEFLKIIRRTPNGSFVRAMKGINPSAVPFKEFLKSHMFVSTELLARIRNYENMQIGHYFLSSNREKLNQCIKKIDSALAELRDDYNQTDLDEVFAFSFSCASFTPPVKEEDKRGVK